MKFLSSSCAILGFAALYACTSTTNVYVVDGDGGTALPVTDANAVPSSNDKDATSDDRDADTPSKDDDGGSTKSDAAQPPTDAGKPWIGPTCARTKPSAAQFGWSLPATAAACNDRDLQFISQQLQNGATYRSVESRLFNQTCASCVFSELTDSAWGPIVFTNVAGNNGFKNFGGCYIAAGKSAACGEKYAKVDYCWRGVCDQCATQVELDQCVQRASTEANGPCFSEYNDANAACGGLAGVVGCTDLFASIRTMCGSGLP